MASRLIYGHDADLCKWASMHLFGHDDAFDEKARAIGVMLNGRIIAAFVYNNYLEVNGKPHSIELSVVSIDKRWMAKHTIREMFAYPFAQLKLERLQILTRVSSEGVNSVVKRLGFIKEGKHRKAYGDGSNAYSWAMLREECRWL